MKKFIIVIIVLISFCSCVAVREYEKVYLNDDEMKLGSKNLERFESNFQIYREGSAGGNGGKTGGGCGCN